MKKKYYLEFPDSMPLSLIKDTIKSLNAELDVCSNPINHIESSFFVSVVSDSSIEEKIRKIDVVKIYDNELRQSLF